MASANHSRRNFLRKLAATSTVGTLAPTAWASAAETLPLNERAAVAPNDRVQLATIGTGIIGFVDTRTALEVPGVELVAAADCYEARLTRVREVFGQHVATTRDYREILQRSDVDAIIIATPDHWHAQIAREAMEAGKDVYCEKPMVHDLSEGIPMVETQEQTDRVLQVGSQHPSSIVVDKVRELYASGAIGELNMIEARYNRNSALGAWQYSIPPEVSTDEIDWERFLGSAPDRSFDPVRFFRWRNYWDYGTGVAGDLFVHLITTVHYVTGSIGPTEITSTGGLRFWNDGREVPDVQTSLFEYPETDSHPAFTLSLQVNLADGSGGSRALRFIGSDGAIILEGDRVTLSQGVRQPPSLDGLVHGYNSVRTFSEAVQQAFIDDFEARHADQVYLADELETANTYEAPNGYDSRLDHFLNFFEAIRTGGSVVEDTSFGFRAAAPSLLCNLSYREGRRYTWDPEAMAVASS